MLKKFVKKQQSRSVCCDFTKKNLSLTTKIIINFFFLNSARVRGSVFRMKFRVLAREFESIKTSPGFAQLLGEKWN